MVFEILGLLGLGGKWGIPLEDPRSMSLNGSYHKEQEYIWFRGGDLSSFRDIMPFMTEGVGAEPWGTPGVCQ